MAKIINIDFESLIENGTEFQALKKELISCAQQSLTGITNFVVNFEETPLIDSFLNACYKNNELYNETIHIDAVELQHGAPGKMRAYKYLDELIYGEIETIVDPDLGIPIPQSDPQTGKRKRKPNGFVNRKIALTNTFKDKLLIIRNIDYSLDFCEETPGDVSSKAVELFDVFRDAKIRRKCRLLLISNKKLNLPFQVRTVEMKPVDEYCAQHIVQSFENLYENNNYEINFSTAQKEQICRKLSGLTYTEASDVFAYALSSSAYNNKVNTLKVLKKLRQIINKKFMEKGFGLQQLTARPWEDYICPEESSFTWDVKKLLRDFNEIKDLRAKVEEKVEAGEDETFLLETIEKIQNRIPHVMVLFGKGGVGKSAMPVHLAGLLGFDVWDFNINALHSKWVGESSNQARDSIKSIMSTSHVIIRIDEYDRAMGSSGNSSEGMHSAHKQVESEFMAWLQNGQEENEFIKKNIFVVMTTNHKDSITGPMLRSGRVDLVIDIDNFDSKSMEETLRTSARRMNNRGVKVLGFKDELELQNAIDSLDLNVISELCMLKGFTVRDIETLIVEMASYKYYHDKGQEGLAWTTENFTKVLENSSGTMKEDDSTGELVLGDREVFSKKKKQIDVQGFLDFGDSNENVNEELGFIELT
jgi:hypothetical protein